MCQLSAAKAVLGQYAGHSNGRGLCASVQAYELLQQQVPTAVQWLQNQGR